jgi:hypothetical protein
MPPIDRYINEANKRLSLRFLAIQLGDYMSISLSPYNLVYKNPLCLKTPLAYKTPLKGGQMTRPNRICMAHRPFIVNALRYKVPSRGAQHTRTGHKGGPCMPDYTVF